MSEPARKLPPNSCDCHMHVFGDPAIYPENPNAAYSAPVAATFEASVAMHAELGIERAVIVQTSTYGTDHRLLIDTLNRAPKDRYRGVAIVNDTVTDDDLAVLDAAGVRAARLNFVRFLNARPDVGAAMRTIDRIAELGWFVKIFVDGDDIVELQPTLARIRIPVEIDHLAAPVTTKPLTQPAFAAALELFKKDNWWVLLSGGDRHSQYDRGYDDAVPFARAFVEAAPDRVIWATDWPHVMYPKRTPDDHELVDLLHRYTDDPATIEQILVHNPARLFGFPT